MPAAVEALGILRFWGGESGIFINHASDKYGLCINLFSVPSSVSSCLPTSATSMRSVLCLSSYTANLCNPGTTVNIRGLKCSLLNLKPRSMNPLTSSSSSSPKVLQLMDLGNLPLVIESARFLRRFRVDGDDEHEPFLHLMRLNLDGISFSWLISFSWSSLL